MLCGRGFRSRPCFAKATQGILRCRGRASRGDRSVSGGWPRHPKLAERRMGSGRGFRMTPCYAKASQGILRRRERSSRVLRGLSAGWPRHPKLAERRMAERGGFEPPVRLPVHMISNHAHSTTLSPLRALGRSRFRGPAAGRGDTQRPPRARVNPQIRRAAAFRRAPARTTTVSDARHSPSFWRVLPSPVRTLKGEGDPKCVLRGRGPNPSLRGIFSRRRLTHHGHRQHRTRLQQQG